MIVDSVIDGPIEVALWLAVLQRPGPLFGCLACRTSTVWWHPTHGGVHPRCIPRAMVLVAGDDEGGTPRRSRSRLSGAYARHGSV